MDDAPRTTPPPPRRWFQFRLRTLLIIVAIAAVECRLVPPAVNEIIAYIQKVRGSQFLDDPSDRLLEDAYR